MGNVVLFLVAVFIVIADQLTKLWIRSNVALDQIIWQAGFLRIDRIENTGAAFGLFRNLTLILSVFSIIGVVIILTIVVVMHRRRIQAGAAVMVALGLVLGGTIGNLIDRLRLGHVVDFLDFTYWPAFNVADASVVVGVVIIVAVLFGLIRTGKGQDAR